MAKPLSRMENPTPMSSLVSSRVHDQQKPYLHLPPKSPPTRANLRSSERTHLFSLGNSNPLGLTNFLFTPYLKLVGTEEQVKYWLPLAEEGKIIGSYAQTELGHGTFVAGIETTATFDKTTDEFVINTPQESATKYWPGAIGFTATHTILLARMIIDGKDYGIHPFMMQLRNMEDFKPLEGIELGDIG